MNGMFGKLLDVNLTNETITDYDIPEEWIEKYLGGRGLGARILWEEMEGGEDPLGPENILMFLVGPLQGTGIPGAGRHAVLAKSPKTNSINDSYAGGFFAHELATSGYDGIIIRGEAESPKYISLQKGKGEIRDAKDIWGLSVAETEEKLKEENGGGRVSCIGLGGENLVKFACIMNDRNRAAGRPGFGAVMGSKKLKAVIVKGGLKKPVHDEDKLKEARLEFFEKLKTIEGWGKIGSSGALSPLNSMGSLPTKNFQEGVFDGADEITGQTMYEKIVVNRDTCTGCPRRCKRVVKTEFGGEEVKEEYGGPEYETIAAFGSLCLNDNIDSIALANQKCNEYSLDTISAGSAIAFAMEASEKGMIDLDIEWGDAEKIIDLIDKIANREGIGDLLARGIDEVAREIKADFAMEVKGVELPMHEPRGKKAMALTYATTPRGPNHNEVFHDDFMSEHPEEMEMDMPIDRFDLESKPEFNKVYEEVCSFTNSVINCAYTSFYAYFHGAYTYPEIRKALNALTGIEIDKKEMLMIGERNINLLKLLSIRDGIDRSADKLPRRFSGKMSRGPSAEQSISDDDMQRVIDKYYEVRGWTEEGPTKEKLEELGMSDLK